MIVKSTPLNGRSGHEAAWELLASVYANETGETLPAVERNPWNKPYFPGSPWHFSLSHTKKHAFCVLAKENVGLDAEELDRPIPLRLAEKVLSPMEKARFDASTDRHLALLTFWVLKEAAAKRDGTGLRGYPNHTNFSLDDPRVQILDGCLVAVLTEETEETHAV